MRGLYISSLFFLPAAIPVILVLGQGTAGRGGLGRTLNSDEGQGNQRFLSNFLPPPHCPCPCTVQAALAKLPARCLWGAVAGGCAESFPAPRLLPSCHFTRSGIESSGVKPRPVSAGGEEWGPGTLRTAGTLLRRLVLHPTVGGELAELVCRWEGTRGKLSPEVRGGGKDFPVVCKRGKELASPESCCHGSPTRLRCLPRFGFERGEEANRGEGVCLFVCAPGGDGCAGAG